jgi:hypothetical protein
VTERRFLPLAVCGGALLFLTALGLYRQNRDDLDGFVAVAVAQSAAYFTAVWLASRAGGSRNILALILIVAAAMRLAALLSPPYLSDDIHRYIWDGRVLGAGINPYRYIPTDPHLESLRDATIFPEINRSTYAPTIYPPGAQAVFFAVTRISGSVTAMKAAMVAFEAVAMLALLRLLIGSGLSSTRLLIYAWHPLPVWEFAGSGHIDAALVAFVALALWLRQRGSGALAGLALAAATLVKFYPAVLAPAIYRRSNWIMPIAFAAAVSAAYLPFIGVGWRVFGFLPGYMAEEGFAGGSGFYFLGLLRLAVPDFPPSLYVGVAALLLAGLGLAILFGRPAPDRGIAAAAALATVFMLLLSPHYPWYFSWLVPFACLLQCRSLVWLTAASLLLYLVPVGSHLIRDQHRLLVETAIYAPFAALALVDWRARRQGRHGTHADG